MKLDIHHAGSSNITLAFPAHFNTNKNSWNSTWHHGWSFYGPLCCMNLKGRMPETRFSSLEFGNNNILGRIMIWCATIWGSLNSFEGQKFRVWWFVAVAVSNDDSCSMFLKCRNDVWCLDEQSGNRWTLPVGIFLCRICLLWTVELPSFCFYVKGCCGDSRMFLSLFLFAMFFHVPWKAVCGLFPHVFFWFYALIGGLVSPALRAHGEDTQAWRCRSKIEGAALLLRINGNFIWN